MDLNVITSVDCDTAGCRASELSRKIKSSLFSEGGLTCGASMRRRLDAAIDRFIFQDICQAKQLQDLKLAICESELPSKRMSASGKISAASMEAKLAEWKAKKQAAKVRP